MKQKRNIYFTFSTGEFRNGATVEIRCESPWKAGKSRNKFRRTKSF